MAQECLLTAHDWRNNKHWFQEGGGWAELGMVPASALPVHHGLAMQTHLNKHTHSLWHPHILIFMYTHALLIMFTCSHTQALMLIHPGTLTVMLMHSYTHVHIHALTDTHKLSLWHTHAHTYALMPLSNSCINALIFTCTHSCTLRFPCSDT